MFALQIKRDLLTGALACQQHTSILLASYIVQGILFFLTFICTYNTQKTFFTIECLCIISRFFASRHNLFRCLLKYFMHYVRQLGEHKLSQKILLTASISIVGVGTLYTPGALKVL